MKILVIVPAYNEEANITTVIKDLQDNFPPGDIVIVNDGSEDKTSALAKTLGVDVIDLSYNIGIGGAVQTGFVYALSQNYDAAIQFDGDGQHLAMEIPKLLRPHMVDGVDLVVGSRFLSDGGYNPSVQRRIGAKILSLIVTLLVRKKITDTTSGFRLYSRKAMRFFASIYPEDYAEVEALVLAHKKGLTIEEVPSQMNPRLTGQSSITILRAVYYMVKVVLAIFIIMIKRMR
jgi:glycosyltransferase involved in cell wall biosynthesis